jgi:hypothetical protein
MQRRQQVLSDATLLRQPSPASDPGYLLQRLKSTKRGGNQFQLLPFIYLLLSLFTMAVSAGADNALNVVQKRLQDDGEWDRFAPCLSRYMRH